MTDEEDEFKKGEIKKRVLKTNKPINMGWSYSSLFNSPYNWLLTPLFAKI